MKEIQLTLTGSLLSFINSAYFQPKSTLPRSSSGASIWVLCHLPPWQKKPPGCAMSGQHTCVFGPYSAQGCLTLTASCLSASCGVLAVQVQETLHLVGFSSKEMAIRAQALEVRGRRDTEYSTDLEHSLFLWVFFWGGGLVGFLCTKCIIALLLHWYWKAVSRCIWQLGRKQDAEIVPKMQKLRTSATWLIQIKYALQASGPSL